MLLDAVYPPDPRVENEAVSLIEAGHEVFLFCLHYGSQSSSETHKGIFVRRFLSNKLEYKLSALAYTVPFYTNWMAKKISRFIKENSIEILHIHDIRIAEAAFKSNKNFHLPVVLDLHENRPEIMKYYEHLQKFPGKYLISTSKWKKKETEFVKKSTRVVVVTEEAKAELIARCEVSENKIVVVPNTVRKSFFEACTIDNSIVNRYKNNFVILYLGDTGLRRGLQTAISAVEKLKKSIPNIKLVVVGNSSSDEVLKQQVSDLNLENFVDFEGWQSVHLFPSYIEASSVCISPLHRNIHHDTTFANKLFQYMCFSKPVLVSDALAQKNVVEKVNAGLVHEAENAADFEQKTLQLFQNNSETEKMGANGCSFVKNEFLWEMTSKKLIAMYNSFSV